MERPAGGSIQTAPGQTLRIPDAGSNRAAQRCRPVNHPNVARARPLVLVVAVLLLVAAPGYPDDASPVDGWAFRPIKRPAVPTPPAEDKARVRNPVDAFVLAKLAANGLRPTSEA